MLSIGLQILKALFKLCHLQCLVDFSLSLFLSFLLSLLAHVGVYLSRGERVSFKCGTTTMYTLVRSNCSRYRMNTFISNPFRTPIISLIISHNFLHPFVAKPHSPPHCSSHSLNQHSRCLSPSPLLPTAQSIASFWLTKGRYSSPPSSSSSPSTFSLESFR